MENETDNLIQSPTISDTLSIVSLKFWKEGMIRNEMVKMENLIKHLESRDFYEKYGVGRFWFDKSRDNFVKECKEHLIYLAKQLADSPNYR